MFILAAVPCIRNQGAEGIYSSKSEKKKYLSILCISCVAYTKYMMQWTRGFNDMLV